MKTLDLTIEQRFRLMELVAVQEISVTNMRTLGKIYDKMIPNPEEKEQAEWADRPDVGPSFNRAKDFSTKVDLEDAEVAEIKRLISDWKRFTIFRDRAWLEPLRKELGLSD
jgi:hypothetical protein